MSDSLLATLISRLETVTSRLESLEKQVGSGAAAPSSSGASEGVSAVFVAEYEDLVNQHIKAFVDTANKLGDKVVSEQAALVLKAVESQIAFLKVAASCKKPSETVLQSLLKPTSDIVGQIAAITEKNRASKFFNNLSAVSEGMPALGWVGVAPTPGPFVGDMKGGSEFYSNRILKDFKGKDQTQVDFVTHFNTFLKDLQNYIKKHHTTGTSWNPKGGEASASAAPAASGPAAPPPPPPGSLSFPESAPGPASKKGPDMSGLLSALNKGSDITSGLKKVTNDMKTKNRPVEERSSVVPATAAKEPSGSAAAKKVVSRGPPKLALEGTKWCIENQDGNKSIVIENTETRQTVYIYRCNNSVIQIKGKVNSIAVDDCLKTAVVFENALSSIEVVNCKSLEVQVTGKVPTVAIDKTSGIQVYFPDANVETEIVSSKSDSMNILFPGPDKELVELPVPEQYKTHIKNFKLHTETVAHV